MGGHIVSPRTGFAGLCIIIARDRLYIAALYNEGDKEKLKMKAFDSIWLREVVNCELHRSEYQ